MRKFTALTVLSLVLCAVAVQNANAGVCFTWTDFGWSACSTNVADEGECIQIAADGEWPHHYYIDENNCGAPPNCSHDDPCPPPIPCDCDCFDNLPYYVAPAQYDGEEFANALHRWVFVVEHCTLLPFGWKENYELDQAWDYIDDTHSLI